jgi:hypothetical protein
VSDDSEIGAVIDEMYAMISGPAGPRDWSRQSNSFLPEARQVRTWVDAEGRATKKSMTLDEYSADTTPFFAANPFFEVEIARRIDRFGNVAHVWSHYEARRAPDDDVPERRGVTRFNCSRIPTAAGGSST